MERPRVPALLVRRFQDWLKREPVFLTPSEYDACGTDEDADALLEREDRQRRRSRR